MQSLTYLEGCYTHWMRVYFIVTINHLAWNVMATTTGKTNVCGLSYYAITKYFRRICGVKRGVNISLF